MEEERTPMDEEEYEAAPEQHEPPRLIELGDYAELTRGAQGASNDAGEVGS